MPHPMYHQLPSLILQPRPMPHIHPTSMVEPLRTLYRPASCTMPSTSLHWPMPLPTFPRCQPASSCIVARPRRARVAVGGSAVHTPQQHTETTQTAANVDTQPAIWLGYPRTLHDHYIVGQLLGSGGNGTVHVVRSRATGEEFACKSIPKTLDAEKHSPAKVASHLDAVRREVEVLTRLRGTLNVVALEHVLEDANHVHLIMELCHGGELWHRIGDRHYSERTVASFMRAVLRTIAQCHSHNILHRDIKPGNFLMLHQGDRAPLKAIDFGLAVFFDPAHLPRSDLGLEGTPWFMAPEVLSSQVLPASDVWSAGVMAFQLLTGRFPFDDRTNPHNPALSQIWYVVACEYSWIVVSQRRCCIEGPSHLIRSGAASSPTNSTLSAPTGRA